MLDVFLILKFKFLDKLTLLKFEVLSFDAPSCPIVDQICLLHS